MVNDWRSQALAPGTMPKAESKDDWRSKALAPGQQEEESTLKNTFRKIYQPIAGVAEKFTWPADIASLVGQGAIRGENAEQNDIGRYFAEKAFPEQKQGRFTPEEINQQVENAANYFPTQANIERGIEETTGAPLQPRSETDKALRMAGLSVSTAGKGLAKKAIAGVTAPTIAAGAKALGVPEPIANVLGLGGGNLASNIPQAIKQIGKKPEVFPSGLTKHKFVETQHPKLASMQAAKQTQIVEDLNTEAAKLAKKTLEKHRPEIKKIETGHDFKAQFEKDFGNIETLAKKYNPTIDITPVSKFLQETRKDIGNLPIKRSEVRKILKEAKEFSRNPSTELSPLLKLIRLNNEELGKIYESSLVTGKQKRYASFLKEFNKSIEKSMQNTLPEDSQFFNLYKTKNKEYSDYLNTLQAEKSLKPLLGGKPTLLALEKFAEHGGKQKLLKKYLGEEGAEEVIQLSKDLKASREALKKIPTHEIHGYERYLPLSLLIPDPTHILPVVGAAKTAYSGYKLAKKFHGDLLAKPIVRKEYDKALKAFVDGNKSDFHEATKNLKEVISKE